MSAAAVILFPFFALRLFGAGDVKIMAVGTAIFGLAGGAEIIAAGLIAGAVFGISKMIIQNSFKRRFLILSAYFMQIFRTKELVPYYQAYQDNDEGVIPFSACLLAGYIFLIFMSGNFRVTL